jgi:hypothetical protein
MVFHGRSRRTETAAQGFCPDRVMLFSSSRRKFNFHHPLSRKLRPRRPVLPHLLTAAHPPSLAED